MKQQPNPRSEINLQDKSGADVIYNVINIKVDIIDRWSIVTALPFCVILYPLHIQIHW